MPDLDLTGVFDKKHMGQYVGDIYSRYAMMNASVFRPGELEKLLENDKQLADCRARRKAAILRASRLTV